LTRRFKSLECASLKTIETVKNGLKINFKKVVDGQVVMSRMHHLSKHRDSAQKRIITGKIVLAEVVKSFLKLILKSG